MKSVQLPNSFEDSEYNPPLPVGRLICRICTGMKRDRQPVAAFPKSFVHIEDVPTNRKK